MNKFYIIISLFITIPLNAQNIKHIIHGKVQHKSNVIGDVHIINKTSNRGTISNKNGEFNIMVNENDTIQFSDVQFKTKIIIISKKDLKNEELKINLIEKNNELDEVVIENMAKSLGLPNAGKRPLNKLERNLNAYSQESLPIVIIATLLGQQGGIDDIYNIVTGNRKRDRKLKKLVDADRNYELKKENIQIIRDHFTDVFFIDTIKITKNHIDSFINFCIPKGIEYLYKKQRYLEIVDIFIQNKENYLSFINKSLNE